MLFPTKLVQSSGNIILNICDPELLDKTVKDDKVEIKIKSDYYLEKMRDIQEIKELMENSTSINLVGEKSISLAKENGFATEKGTRVIEGIPFLLIFKM